LPGLATAVTYRIAGYQVQIFKARFYSFGILRGLEKIGDPTEAERGGQFIHSGQDWTIQNLTYKSPVKNC
jgi:monoamine oxidase